MAKKNLKEENSEENSLKDSKLEDKKAKKESKEAKKIAKKDAEKAKKEFKEAIKEKKSSEKDLKSKTSKKEEKELAKLNKDLIEKDEIIVELSSHLQRLQADFDNFRKQTEKHNKEIKEYANEGLILNFIDSYEDMGRVLENSKTEEDLKEGLKLIYSKIRNTLEKEGVKEIPTVGEQFDPFKHYAQGVVNSPKHKNNEIIAEIMKGYTLKDRVIKNPIVLVCKKDSKEEKDQIIE